MADEAQHSVEYVGTTRGACKDLEAINKSRVGQNTSGDARGRSQSRLPFILETVQTDNHQVHKGSAKKKEHQHEMLSETLETAEATTCDLLSVFILAGK